MYADETLISLIFAFQPMRIGPMYEATNRFDDIAVLGLQG